MSDDAPTPGPVPEDGEKLVVAQARQQRRPFILSLICIVGTWMFIHMMIGVAMLHAPQGPQWNEMYPQINVQVLIGFEMAKFLGLVGFWLMRRGGVVLYAAATVLHLAWYLSIGMEATILFKHLIYVINTGLGIVFWKSMR